MDKMEIQTPAGVLVIESKGSYEDYPGVYVSMGNGAPIATVEYTPDRFDGTAGIQVLAWRDACAEEASDWTAVENIDSY